MLLSIVIVNWNTGGLLKQYLKSIELLNLNFDYEIIVIDSGSKDGSVEMLKRDYPNVQLIINKNNQGANKANNQGLKAATGKYILLSNSDIQIPKGAIKQLIEFMERDTSDKIAAIGPQLLNPNLTKQNTYFRDVAKFPILIHLIFPAFRRTILGKTRFAKKRLNFFLMQNKQYNKIIKPDWVLGSFVLVRKKILYEDNIGFLDEKMHSFMWESDWFKRMRERGYSICYYPKVKIIHYPHRVSAGGIKKIFSKKSWIHIIDWFKYLYKWRIKKRTTAH